MDADAVRVENCRQFGGPWLALELIRQLQLGLILIIARFCEPSIELYVAEQWYPIAAAVLRRTTSLADGQRRCALRRLPHAEPPLLVDVPQPRYHPLPRTALGAVRFDERPLRPPLAVAIVIVLSAKHARMLRQDNRPPRPTDLTTSRSAANRTAAKRLALEKRLRNLQNK